MREWAIRITAVVLAVCVVGVVPVCEASRLPRASAQLIGKKPELSGEARERILHAVDAVGLILVRRLGEPANSSPRPRGSAVVIRKDGLVVTNHHVIAEDKGDRIYDEIYFSLPSKTGASPAGVKPRRLDVLLLNKSYDLALLRVIPDGADPMAAAPAELSAIELGDSHAVRLLDDVTIIGFPEKGGATVTVNTGFIEGADLLENWIKTDARLIHGNSGGAAVNSRGELIGIPTKVVADRQPVDKDGDGFPDDYKWLGAVGFLRPAYLIESMLAQVRSAEVKGAAANATKSADPQNAPEEPIAPVTVRGLIKSAVDGKPIAGARVGLTPPGASDATASNLLTWGGANGEGQFTLNKPVPPGRYSLKAKAIGYEGFTRDVEIGAKMEPLVIELRPPQ